jgi:LDH2 family malate/lactate/ureidoglycolate dehydrogenase
LNTQAENRVLSKQEYIDFCTSALLHQGVSPEQAAIVVEALLWCDLHGISSHGANMLPTYLDRLNKGGIRLNQTPKIIKKHGAIAQLDGGGGFGQVIGRAAADLACELAAEHGLAAVSVRSGNHAGALGCFGERIARAGNIGFIASNSNPTVAPFGGRKPALGTNPISFAFPGKEYPIVVDLATSATAKGKLYEMARTSSTLPPGLVLNQDGQPAASMEEALKGILLPLGGPKGYALAVAVEILAGVLSGGKISKEIDSFHHSPDQPQDVSMFVAAFAVEAFMTQDEYLERVARLETYLVETPPMEGFERVNLPGEREAQLADRRLKEGIPLSENLYQDILRFVEN